MTSDADAPLRGLLVTGDLFFSSKITGTAEMVGGRLDVASSAATALDRLRENGVRCVVVDLATPGLNIADLTSAVAEMSPRPQVIAFGAHVDVSRLQAARDAGCDLVLPRSRFTAELPLILRQALATAAD